VSIDRLAARRRRTRRRALLAGAAGAVAALLAWAALVEPRTLVVRRSTLRLPRWPARLDGLRVAVVSDLHSGAPHVRERRLERVVERVNREAPDLVALLGDYVDPVIPGFEPLAPEHVAARLGELHASLGTVAVLGNHDWANDGERVAAALRATGIRVLENEAVELRAGGSHLWVAGLADLRERDADLESALPDDADAAGLLLLSHDPDVFPDVPERVSLTIAGHLHGGQIDVPYLRRLVIPSRFGSRYRDGHMVEDGRHLFVSRGLGTSGVPLRLRAPAGIDVLELIADG
jgi:uncharacterized protein